MFEVMPNFSFVIDDNVVERTEVFALVAQLGDDVPDSFACFQLYLGSLDCTGRTGAAQIEIMDNDGMFVIEKGLLNYISDICLRDMVFSLWFQ